MVQIPDSYSHIRILLLGMVLLLPEITLGAEVSTKVLSEIRWAINTHDVRAQSFRLGIKPEIALRFDNGVKLTAIGRLRAEAVDGLQPNKVDRDSYSNMSRPAHLSDSVEFELRELYVETAVGEDYLTLGKQQVVWGKADGLKVLDVVNPQSYESFILDDFEDSRIPLWTLNYEWQINDNSILQFLWIPDQTMHRLPNVDATYAFTTTRLVPKVPDGVNVVLRDANKPSRVIADSDVGLRWSSYLGGWDVTLNYLYHYEDLPVFYQRLSVTPTGATAFIEPKYERSHLIGSSFTNAFGDLTFRGELAYATDKYFLTTNRTDDDGVTKRDELSYVFGFDWFGFEDTLLSVQLFQSYVINPPTGLTRPNVDTTLMLLAQQDFLNETLKAEILILHNINDGDGLLRPKVAYELQDDLKVWLGLDVFYGRRQGLFGEFDHNDQIVTGLEIGF